jgi:hypothetical protein
MGLIARHDLKQDLSIYLSSPVILLPPSLAENPSITSPSEAS